MKFFILIAGLLVSLAASAQLKSWSFQEVDSLLQKSPRPVLVFIQTSWCSYCHMMIESTLKDEKIIALLNGQFYFLPFNAEQQKEIYFRGQRFKFRPSGYNKGLNELAPILGSINGRLAYPAICILNMKDEIVLQKNGFLSSEQLIPLLRAVLTNK